MWTYSLSFIRHLRAFFVVIVILILLSIFSAVLRPSSRSWTLSLSTFLQRNLSATCQAKHRHDSAAQRVTGLTLAQHLARLPPTLFWLSSVTIWSCCQVSAADRSHWWRLLRTCRPTSCPGPTEYSGRCKTSWKNTLWRCCHAQFLPLMPTTWTMTTCHHPSHPRCSPGNGIYKERKNTATVLLLWKAWWQHPTRTNLLLKSHLAELLLYLKGLSLVHNHSLFAAECAAFTGHHFIWVPKFSVCTCWHNIIYHSMHATIFKRSQKNTVEQHPYCQ